MKKIYIEPKTELINVKLCSMIAVSTPIDNVDAGKDGNGDYDDSRRLSNFDWDED